VSVSHTAGKWLQLLSCKFDNKMGDVGSGVVPLKLPGG